MACALGIGGVIAVQSRINGELGHRIHDGIFAAVISFTVGLLLLVIVIACRRESREHLTGDLPQAYRSGRLVWWQFLGGLGGASVVASQTLTVPLLGVALFTVALVAGMTGSSLLVDRIGLAPSCGCGGWCCVVVSAGGQRSDLGSNPRPSGGRIRQLRYRPDCIDCGPRD